METNCTLIDTILEHKGKCGLKGKLIHKEKLEHKGKLEHKEKLGHKGKLGRKVNFDTQYLNTKENGGLK